MKRLLYVTALCCSCIKGGAEEPTPFTVWSGWNHTWEMLSHRVSLIRVKATSDSTAESGILGGDWSTGATWSDSVGYRIHSQTISSHQLSAQQGETILTIGPEGTASTMVDIDGFDADLVLLSGFEITTDIEQPDEYPSDYDPALGYTSRGFGMSVSLNPNGNVDVQGSVRWGPRDRDDMNAALAVAESQLTIWWTAISGIEEEHGFHMVKGQELAHDPPYSEQNGLREDLPWSGTGIAGISNFDLRLYDTDGGDGGDYLRSFGIEMVPSPDASVPNSISAEILTSSALELGTMSMNIEAQTVWIPLETSINSIAVDSLEGIHDIGVHTVSDISGS